MDDASASLAAAIGARVRRERVARSWTLDQLALAAGLSRRLLVNVEHGTANPSVGTLLRLSEALGVGLPSLVEPPTRRPVQVTRAGEGPVLWTTDAGGRAVMLAGIEAPDAVELWEWTLGPGDRHESSAHRPGTRELLTVAEGTVEVVAGGESVTLQVGDSVAFPGDVAHAYGNAGAGAAHFQLAVFEPRAATETRTTSDDA